MAEPATEGVWGAIARRTESPDGLARALIEELESGLAVLQRLPPAVTFFGGARIQPTDRYYGQAERMGALLARLGLPPRTGAGPGVMTAVPQGYRRALAQPVGGRSAGESPASRPQALTQGFNIQLPFEQAVNPDIEVSLELSHFPTRKLMLYENALGLVIFPGGFGTLDELFEAWRLKSAGVLSSPFVLFGRDFWEPLLATLEAMTLGGVRRTVPPDVFGLVELCDDAERAIAVVTERARQGPFDEPLRELGRRVARELVEGLGYLSRLPRAVTVIGGTRLAESDPIVRTAEAIARRLARAGVPTRASGPGPFSVALARGGHQGSRYLPQQAFGMRREDARNLYGADRVHLVNDRLTHKVLLTETSRAVVVLPGGLGTLDELFSVVCQLQTRKIPSRRVVLVGHEFWTPLIDTIRRKMLEPSRRLISVGDLDLFTLSDDPGEVAELCLLPPPELAARA